MTKRMIINCLIVVLMSVSSSMALSQLQPLERNDIRKSKDGAQFIRKIVSFEHIANSNDKKNPTSKE